MLRDFSSSCIWLQHPVEATTASQLGRRVAGRTGTQQPFIRSVVAVRARWPSTPLPSSLWARAYWLPEDSDVRTRGQMWPFHSLTSSRGFLVTKKKKCMCVGRAGGGREMGRLWLKVLHSSSRDFLVTRTWMTLSPFELPTCSGWTQLQWLKQFWICGYHFYPHWAIMKTNPKKVSTWQQAI